LAVQAISRGTKVRSVLIRERGHNVAELKLASERHASKTPFPFALGLPQSETEDVYIADLAARGVDIAWSTSCRARSGKRALQGAGPVLFGVQFLTP
jgi:hypothetical protein